MVKRIVLLLYTLHPSSIYGSVGHAPMACIIWLWWSCLTVPKNIFGFVSTQDSILMAQIRSLSSFCICPSLFLSLSLSLFLSLSLSLSLSSSPLCLCTSFCWISSARVEQQHFCRGFGFSICTSVLGIYTPTSVSHQKPRPSSFHSLHLCIHSSCGFGEYSWTLVLQFRRVSQTKIR